MQNYNIEEDIIYKDFMEIKKDKAENTKRHYKTLLQDFCNANNLTLYEIYKNCKEEQHDLMVNNRFIKFSPNDITTHTKQYFNNFINYIEINKSLYKTERKTNRANTINNKVRGLKVFFAKYDLQLPDWEEKEDDSKKWYPLSKSDIEYVINDCSLEHTALITFMMSTGMRESDVVNLTIRDFMEATRKMNYHNYVDVEEFIDNAPDNMQGFFDFYPQKTISDKVRCMTMNNRESSNYILQVLRKIKNQYLPKYNKRNGTELKISKDSALFGSRNYNYLGHLRPHSITQAFFKKNKKLREYYLAKIEEQIRNNEISKEDREIAIEQIPTFHPHQLRRYFITAVRRYARNISYSAMMEGHAPPMANDQSYVNITMEDITKIYNEAIYELSLFEVNEDAIFDSKSEELRAEWSEEKAEWAEEKTRLNEKLLEHEAIQQQKDAEIAELKAELVRKTSAFEERLVAVENQLPHLSNTNPVMISTKDEPVDILLMIAIENIINHHKGNVENPQWLDAQIQGMKSRDLIALKDIAYDLVRKEEHKPQTYDELVPLLIKAIFKMEENPQLVQESVRFHNERSLNQTKIMRYTEILYDLLAENYLTDEEREEWEKHKQWEKEHNAKLLTKEFSESRLAKMADLVSVDFYADVNDYLLEEITKDFVMADIEKYL